jgi:hypothetical protein
MYNTEIIHSCTIVKFCSDGHLRTIRIFIIFQLALCLHLKKVAQKLSFYLKMMFFGFSIV